MPRFIWKWIVTSIAILIVPHLISGVSIDGYSTALAVAAVLGLLNACIRPVLLVITLPFTILSLGFFILIINAFLFQVAGSVVEGFHIANFGSAFLASLVVSFISWVSNLSYSREAGASRFIVHERKYSAHQNQRGYEGTRDENSRRVVDLNPDEEGKWK